MGIPNGCGLWLSGTRLNSWFVTVRLDIYDPPRNDKAWNLCHNNILTIEWGAPRGLRGKFVGAGGSSTSSRPQSLSPIPPRLSTSFLCSNSLVTYVANGADSGFQAYHDLRDPLDDIEH